ncbi:SAM-dependent methyltransferase [Blastopirellula marina]|uniref:site-specific DNA-methyltransferase (adenine-specific) n=1 Tax=Blastopirellula marina TaxID=124 RepID=A0A2S8G337_9BACT|nr:MULTISPECIES: type IIL restriction-modification enzyme MmeI [Pirellulaceae]PQO38865.1 SAM-dependent methyltransferase [Blastopirellula marina]RCS55173.1 class I SAM-dependent DNA methyltransferase [Bremerella cremea]
MAKSPEELAHQEWIGYVQPVGLVVSVPAMLEAQCYVNKNIMAEHARFLSCLPRENEQPVPEIRDLAEFTQKVLDWEAADLVDIPARGPLPGNMASLEVILPQYNETLRPTQAVPAFKPEEGQSPWMMLIQELPAGTDFDDSSDDDTAGHWNAAPQAKFERLLRESGVPIGMISNRRQLRLVYAPKGESSGHATFIVDEMTQVAGRPMFAALHMLLCADRMFTLGEKQRLPAILENSRKYQNTVSTKLAEQVLAALYELMRGFQAADDVRQGDLLREVLTNAPNHVYSGLLTVLMRLVFVMYAEDRDLLSSDPVYSNYYSVTGLFNRLREDAGRHPDTMNQRFGAWSQLITLFRLIYEGGQHGDFKLPGRKGYLFDPERYPFLEGRQRKSSPMDEAPPIPRVSDGIVYNVLRNLLILDGERLSYRSLDVEQIGSVYETVMGFNLEVAQGKSIAIKPVKTHGAPATINLEELLATKGKDRAKWLKEQSDQSLGKEGAKLLKDAETIEELLKALDKKVQKKVTPRIVPQGAIVLQPSDERRRSGSHYTPRSLTEPIVRTTLEPILNQLCDPEADLPEVYQPSREDKKRYTTGEIQARVVQSQRAIEYAQLAREIGIPHPAQILDLKICDPAMGSGAFLVETCRQLGDHLIDAWAAHGLTPTDIPPDEDEVLYARRLVAQRCLYGVDKNIMAVDLAKLSLWLVTLAKDHPFTFLDHSLRHGDSLVGLTRKQIIGFHWEPKQQKQFGEELIQKRLDKATEARAKILNAREDVPYRDQEQRLAVANEALDVIRLTGDACVSAFFAGSKKKQREERCEELFEDVSLYYKKLKDGGLDISISDRIAEAAASLRAGEFPIPPFHWEIEFPEVFSREKSGFDAFLGNPPFLGGARISSNYGMVYFDYVKTAFSPAGHQCDLVGYFFRQLYSRLAPGGCLGLIATNTIAQGDTKDGALVPILEDGGCIYHATKRFAWPGVAAVVASRLNIAKHFSHKPCVLNGKHVRRISAYLMPGTADHSPSKLKDVPYFSKGSQIYGQGFLFDDSDSKATPLSVMEQIVRDHPNCRERIFPYIGGAEVNSSPNPDPIRFAIYLSDLHAEAELAKWQPLASLIEETVKPERLALGNNPNNRPLKKKWWAYQAHRPELYAAISSRSRVLVCSQVTAHLSFVFLPSTWIYSQKLCVFDIEDFARFCVMQCRVHDHWAWFLCSTMKDDLNYSSSDCFATFPFPTMVENNAQLHESGLKYYQYRLSLMKRNNEGPTSTYNRFHSPLEKSQEIEQLRDLHAAMDQAVLKAYGWHDLAERASCEFLLDYVEEDDEDSGKKTKKKKPWRLRWSDEFRDEVLARLLELNEQRHKEELMTGKQVTKPAKAEDKPKPAKRKKAKRQEQKPTPELFATTLEREHHYLLMILHHWEGRNVTRRVLNECMILMLDDALRAALLGKTAASAANRKEVGVNQILNDLDIDGFIEQAGTTHQQAWRITSSAPKTVEMSADDQKRLDEVLEFLRREQEAGKVTVTEEIVDADVDLIPTS